MPRKRLRALLATKTTSGATRLETPFKAAAETASPVNLSLDCEALTAHVALCGGQTELRTEFCHQLAKSALQEKLPVTMITSNRAYRALVDNLGDNSELAFYTVGETILPLAVNPFELLPDVPVAVHIARLTKIFRELFELSEPIACAMEKVIEAAYIRRGWNLADGRNARLNEQQDSEYHSDIYPLMPELLDTLDAGLEACGFEQQVKNDAKSHIQAVLTPLVSGINRSIFCERAGASAIELFSRSAVIETSALRTPRDRALYAAFLLCLCEESFSSESSQLHHLIVLDDIAQMPDLVGDSRPDMKDSPPQPLTFDLDKFSKAGYGIVFSGLRGTQLAATRITEPGIAVMFRERNTFALSSLGRFASLDLATLNSVKTLGAFDMLVQERSEKPQMFTMDPLILAEIAVKGTTPDELVVERCKCFSSLAPLDSPGSKYFPEAFDLDSLAIADKLVQNKFFYRVFVRYISSFTNDLTQLVHFRVQVIHEIQRIVGKKTPEALRKISWCAISMASDRYFTDKALINHWTLDQERDMVDRWYSLLAPAFVAESVNPSLNRRLNISQVRLWRDQFLELEAVDQGPLPACSACTSKCLFGYDVTQFLADPGLFFDFNSTISRRDTPASESSAWFVRLLCERLIGCFNLDLAYCLAAHLIKAQSLSSDAQLVLLRKVRQHLLVEHSGSEETAQKSSAAEEVRIIQFPNIKDR
ncbi:MAG TPA: hypothetical protein V6C97_28300 [Oculatellaceae cyanobacterium]